MRHRRQPLLRWSTRAIGVAFGCCLLFPGSTALAQSLLSVHREPPGQSEQSGSSGVGQSFDEVKASYQPSDVRILDRDGEFLHRIRTNAQVRRGQWIELDEVSAALRTAIVLSEDKRFYEHGGVDWRAVTAAAWKNLWNEKARGASTITMQLAGLLDADLRRGKNGRDFRQKVGQTLTAQWLELRWRKDQILEAYLNLVPFRGEMVGIDALSRTLFGKAPHGLNNREAAVAAALVRGPNARPADVARRACGVLTLMQQSAADESCEGLDQEVREALERKAFDPSQGIAGHAGRLVLAEWVREGGSKTSVQEIGTTLRAPLQRFATQALVGQLRELRPRNVQDGAVLVLDNATGEVLAWVGSSGTLSRAAQVDAVLAPRQPGSTLKPFLYAQAIADRRMTAASLLDDSGAQLQTGSGLYIPQNYDHKFKGWVSARTALASSLNLPAVRTLIMVSPDAFAKQLRALGMTLNEPGSYYGYSLALGSAEVSLLALTNAYRTLANGGCQSKTASLIVAPGRGARPPCGSLPEDRRAVDPRAAFIVGDILNDPGARAVTFGMDSVLATRYWTAIKTGTSKDMRDNWAVGYSRDYTVGVWVGNASGGPMWDVSGTTGAAPVWAAVMDYLHRDQPGEPPTPPAGLVRQRVTFEGAAGQVLEAARDEWFIAGTEQAQIVLLPSSGSEVAARPGDRLVAHIAAPTDGTILALDPDIPPQAQRVSLRATTSDATQGLTWRIDGKALSQGQSAQWLPWPGRHLVSLTDATGRILDQIALEVRGASATRPARPEATP